MAGVILIDKRSEDLLLFSRVSLSSLGKALSCETSLLRMELPRDLLIAGIEASKGDKIHREYLLILHGEVQSFNVGPVDIARVSSQSQRG